MSISWDTVRPALLSLFADLGGIQTVWIDKRRPYINTTDQAITLLRVNTVNDVGVDDRRYEDLSLAAPAATLEESANGHRLLGLEIRVESFRHDDDRFAFNAAEAIRTKLGFGSTRARLLALNLAVVRKNQTLDLSGIVQDDRATSVAVLEVVLNAGFCLADTTKVYNIETVETTANILPDP